MQQTLARAEAAPAGNLKRCAPRLHGSRALALSSIHPPTSPHILRVHVHHRRHPVAMCVCVQEDKASRKARRAVERTARIDAEDAAARGSKVRPGYLSRPASFFFKKNELERFVHVPSKPSQGRFKKSLNPRCSFSPSPFLFSRSRAHVVRRALRRQRPAAAAAAAAITAAMTTRSSRRFTVTWPKPPSTRLPSARSGED